MATVRPVGSPLWDIMFKKTLGRSNWSDNIHPAYMCLPTTCITIHSHQAMAKCNCNNMFSNNTPPASHQPDFLHLQDCSLPLSRVSCGDIINTFTRGSIELKMIRCYNRHWSEITAAVTPFKPCSRSPHAHLLPIVGCIHHHEAALV